MNIQRLAIKCQHLSLSDCRRGGAAMSCGDVLDGESDARWNRRNLPTL